MVECKIECRTNTIVLNMFHLVDTHAHIYDESFEEDFKAIINRAHSNRVKKIFIPNVDQETIPKLVSLCKNIEGVYGMMGVHPCSIKENYKEELAIAKSWLEKESFVAVGEIGLDLYWDKNFYKEQVDALKTQFHWSLEHNLPVNIHCREAFNEIMEVIELPEFKEVRGIFHCFSGNAEQAKRLVDLGYYLGIGGVLTFKNSGLDKAIENIDLSNIVLETDAPYLAPTPFRGKRNEPSYILNIAEKLAEIKGVDLYTVAQKTSENSEKIYGK